MIGVIAVYLEREGKDYCLPVKSIVNGRCLMKWAYLIENDVNRLICVASK